MLHRITRMTSFGFRTMTPQDYLLNQRDAMLARNAHRKTLLPLQDANQGDPLVSDEIQLIGVPKGQTMFKHDIDPFKRMLLQGQRDLIFLQIYPSAYMARQRFMSHKCAIGKIEDYRMDGIHLIDPHKPITWQQTVVNLLTMDMLTKNALPKQFNYKQGFYTYSYPYLQEKAQTTAITQNFISQISKQILDNRRTGYNDIDKVLYTGLMGKHKVMLGGMPQTQYRMIVGKAVSVQQMRDIFRFVVLKNKELTIPMGIKDATQNFVPHIFLLPEDLYMTALLKQAFQAAMQMVAFVGIQHWRPIQQYWIPPPHGINMTEAQRIPEGFPGQTVQDLIQKQALLDVMLESRVWSRNYLSNPFPYIFDDITKVQQKELESYKKIFIIYYRKYSEFKNKQVQLLEQKVDNLKLQHINQKRKEEMSKFKQDIGSTLSLKHLKEKMVSQKWIKKLRQNNECVRYFVIYEIVYLAQNKKFIFNKILSLNCFLIFSIGLLESYRLPEGELQNRKFYRKLMLKSFHLKEAARVVFLWPVDSFNHLFFFFVFFIFPLPESNLQHHPPISLQSFIVMIYFLLLSYKVPLSL